jgi:hypothetical protein
LSEKARLLVEESKLFSLVNDFDKFKDF